MPLMSIAEYAKLRGCNPTTVMKAIEEGRIASACSTRGGKTFIDSERAQELWANNTLRPHTPPKDSGLSKARIRKALAELDGLEREVNALHDSLTTPAEGAAFVADAVRPLVERLRRLPQPPSDDDVQAFLTWCQEDHAEAVPSVPPATRQRPTTAPAIEAAKVHLVARRTELRNAIAAGELVPHEVFWDRLEAVLTMVRSLLLDRHDVAQATAELEVLLQVDAPPPKAELPPAHDRSSEAQKKRWSDPAYRAFMSERIRLGLARRRERTGRQ